MNAIDIHLANRLKKKQPPPVIKAEAPKVNLKLFGPRRDAKGRFIKKGE